jgi:repressor LexA
MYYEYDYKSLKERMDEKDMDILKFIKKSINRNKYSPSVREITKAVGFKSTSTTFSYLHRLKKKELINWEPKVGRTIYIVENEKGSVK